MYLQNFLRAAVAGALMTLSAGSQAFAQQGPFASEGTFDIPPGAQFNKEKLAKVTEFFKNEVATGKISGADVLIRQRGKEVYHETFGVQDVVSKAPITDKTIFRLSSLTKAITSVVAMQLIEERQDEARRSRLQVHSLLCRCEGRRGEKGR